MQLDTYSPDTLLRLPALRPINAPIIAIIMDKIHAMQNITHAEPIRYAPLFLLLSWSFLTKLLINPAQVN